MTEKCRKHRNNKFKLKKKPLNLIENATHSTQRIIGIPQRHLADLELNLELEVTITFHVIYI